MPRGSSRSRCPIPSVLKMNVDPNICLVCERPAKSQSSISEHFYECPRCGRYSVTHLGRLNLIYKDNDIRWSPRERALLAGCIRARQLRGEDHPRFLYSARKGTGATGDFVEDLLATAPQTVDELVRATLANLGIIAREQYGQWVKLDRQMDLPLAYATTIDDAHLVFEDLQQAGLIKYEPTLDAILFQITLPGWRLIEQIRPPAPAASSDNCPAPIADPCTVVAVDTSDDAASLRGRVTFGVITVREDEFAALLQRFPERRSIRGPKRLYEYAVVPTATGVKVGVAIARLLEQGHGSAQAMAQAFIDELNPSWLLLVGIAGGIPAHEFSLGDVLLSSRLHNFAVSAALEGRSPEFSATGGPMHQDVERLLAHLPTALEGRLGLWNSEEAIGRPKPIVSPPGVAHSTLYGERGWRRKVSNSLLHHFPEGAPPRPPRFHVAATASSNTLVKDTELAKQWLESARHIGAIEMELGGVYDAARHAGAGNCRVLAIRGISDIIGYRRSPAWTEYACNAAASFAHAFIRSGVIELVG